MTHIVNDTSEAHRCRWRIISLAVVALGKWAEAKQIICCAIVLVMQRSAGKWIKGAVANVQVSKGERQVIVLPPISANGRMNAQQTQSGI